MASVLSTHDPILVRRTVSGNQEQIYSSTGEAAGQTFTAGSPVQLNQSGGAAGFIQVWSGTVGSNLIAGISYLPGQNLATNGAGLPPAFGSIGFPGTTLTYGTVPNQSAAVNIPSGAPFSTGATIYAVANQDTRFVAQVDNSTGTGTIAPAASMVGQTMNLVKDANNFWYLDINTLAATSSSNAALITALVQDDLSGTSTSTEINFGHLEFVIQGLASQFTT